MIEVQKLYKTYGKKQNIFTALENIDLIIEDGATVAITGKSGSGKSTLMHVMSGLDHPSKGTVIVNGVDLATMKEKALDAFRAKSMSFIFQAFFVEGNQTCYQNVMLPLEIAKVGRMNRRARVVEALEAVDLADKIDAKARNLSGGQRQRLAIARSIVNKPKLIFADEPTGNLDSSTGEKIINLLFSLNKTMGSTLVVVTHDDELAERCKVKIHLRDGKIVNSSKLKSKKIARSA